MEWLVKILSLRVEDPIDKFLTLVPWIIRRRPQHLEIITHETVESVCNMILNCTPYTFHDPKNPWGRRLFFFFAMWLWSCYTMDETLEWFRWLFAIRFDNSEWVRVVDSSNEQPARFVEFPTPTDSLKASETKKMRLQFCSIIFAVDYAIHYFSSKIMQISIFYVHHTCTMKCPFHIVVWRNITLISKSI